MKVMAFLLASLDHGILLTATGFVEGEPMIALIFLPDENVDFRPLCNRLACHFRSWLTLGVVIETRLSASTAWTLALGHCYKTQSRSTRVTWPSECQRCQPSTGSPRRKLKAITASPFTHSLAVRRIAWSRQVYGKDVAFFCLVPMKPKVRLDLVRAYFKSRLNMLVRNLQIGFHFVSWRCWCLCVFHFFLKLIGALIMATHWVEVRVSAG